MSDLVAVIICIVLGTIFLVGTETGRAFLFGIIGLAWMAATICLPFAILWWIFS